MKDLESGKKFDPIGARKAKRTIGEAHSGDFVQFEIGA
jgi:hypothetical protein